MEVGVDRDGSLNRKGAAGESGSFLGGELLRDPDVLGIGLRGTAGKAPGRGGSECGLGQTGDKGERGETHDGQRDSDRFPVQTVVMAAAVDLMSEKCRDRSVFI